MSRSYPSSPPSASMACSGTALTFTFTCSIVWVLLLVDRQSDRQTDLMKQSIFSFFKTQRNGVNDDPVRVPRLSEGISARQ
jgi:hypothetical protein